jgi:secretion/DNA translocation related TadE-like protein
MMAVLLALTGGGAVVGAAVIARHRAQAAADLAALAAAGQVMDGPDAACASAGAVSTAMDGAVASCALRGLDVVVTVDVRVGLGRWGIYGARASARAGPVT